MCKLAKFAVFIGKIFRSNAEIALSISWVRTVVEHQKIDAGCDKAHDLPNLQIQISIKLNIPPQRKIIANKNFDRVI